jgi:signal transduction histidine kinase
MGLAIARQIMLAHDGDIWVESEPGKGAEFFISAPIDPQEAAL